MNVLFFGLGRIGLPQSLVFAAAGHQVTGYDADPQVVQSLQDGVLPFEEPGMRELMDAQLGRNFRPVSDWQAALAGIDVVLFTLGTAAPDARSCLREETGDIGPIERILATLLAHPQVKKGLLIVFRTTLFLGSTERLKQSIESTTSLREGTDFFLSFVPERLAEGQAIAEERTLPKILSAFSPAGLEQVAQLFAPVGGRQIVVSSPTTAEFCKLTDNSWRNTLFAFANELAMWAGRKGVDAHEVIRAINADYERNSVPKPGFVSGYCLGKDPYIFEYGFRPDAPYRDFQSLWYYGRRTNDAAVGYAVERVTAGLRRLGREPGSARVAVLGLSFKEDIDDFRMSHAFDLVDALAEAGVPDIVGFDPLLGANKYTQIPARYGKPGYQWVSRLDAQVIKDVDAVVVAHRHAVLRNQTRADLAALLGGAVRPIFVFDGWNIWREAEGLQGVTYESLGYRGKEHAA